MSANRFILTTNPGLEDLVEEELRGLWAAEAGVGGPRGAAGPASEASGESGARGARAPEGDAGVPTAGRRMPSQPDLRVETRGQRGQVQVEAACSAERFLEIARRMHSIYHVLQHLHEFTLPAGQSLEAIGREIGRLAIPGMRGAPGFRVTCHRSGEHPFSSMDVQRVAGAVLQARYGTPVDLESYRIDVRIDLLGPSCQVRLQLTREGLDRRFRRVYQPRITLKTPVAYAMLRLARIGGEAAPAGAGGSPSVGGRGGAAGRLLDPFCGSGTILIEAARLFPGLDIVGVDRNPAAVEGARRNVEAAGLSGRIAVRLMDARDISRFYPAGHFRAIVTDPPYGVRLGRSIDYSALYHRLLGEAGRTLAPAGRLVLLVGKRRRPFTRAVFEIGGFSIRHARNVETSGVYPMLFVLEKMGPEGSG